MFDTPATTCPATFDETGGPHSFGMSFCGTISATLRTVGRKKGTFTFFVNIPQCGEGGIRTLGDVAATPVFETGPIGRSGTSPEVVEGDYRSCTSPREVANGQTRLSEKITADLRRCLLLFS
jgi:hypothetical protein